MENAPQGWYSADLFNAYRLVQQVADATSSESSAWPAVKAALDAIEAADCDLESGE